LPSLCPLFSDHGQLGKGELSGDGVDPPVKGGNVAGQISVFVKILYINYMIKYVSNCTSMCRLAVALTTGLIGLPSILTSDSLIVK